MLDFIANNSVWFIIGGVLIVLVIIGYIVDKKGFGTKAPIEPEKEEEVKEEVKARRIIERIKQLTDDIEMISENRRK